MIKCLELCDENNLKTIAFPSIGTGNLKFPSSEVAEIMVNTIQEYFERNPSQISHVHIILYSGNKSSCEAFYKMYEELCGAPRFQSSQTEHQICDQDSLHGYSDSKPVAEINGDPSHHNGNKLFIRVLGADQESVQASLKSINEMVDERFITKTDNFKDLPLINEKSWRKIFDRALSLDVEVTRLGDKETTITGDKNDVGKIYEMVFKTLLLCNQQEKLSQKVQWKVKESFYREATEYDLETNYELEQYYMKYVEDADYNVCEICFNSQTVHVDFELMKQTSSVTDDYRVIRDCSKGISLHCTKNEISYNQTDAGKTYFLHFFSGG